MIKEYKIGVSKYMSKRRKWAYLSILFLALFILYTIMVKTVDVAAIGPNGSKVGLSTINHWFQVTIGMNDTWYEITNNLGYITFAYVIFYAILGTSQLIKKKNIKKVDKKIIALGCLYAALVVIYVLFEKVIINYRPVLVYNVLEASYPSTHTVLAITICMSAIIMGRYYTKDKHTKKLYNGVTILLMALIIIGRILSGVHWLTDIIGGILLSAFLLSLFYAFICHFEQEKKLLAKARNLIHKIKKKKKK